MPPLSIKKKGIIQMNSETSALNLIPTPPVIDEDSESKVYTFKLDFQQSLNSAVVFPAFVRKKPINIGITYNRKTPALKSQVKFYNRKGNISYKMFRKLDECVFAQKYFDITNLEDDHHDYRSKFDRLKETAEGEGLRQFKSERFDFNHAFLNKENDGVEATEQQPNYLHVTGWEMEKFGDDFLFFLAERGIYHRSKDIHIVRVVGVQFGIVDNNEELSTYF